MAIRGAPVSNSNTTGANLALALNGITGLAQGDVVVVFAAHSSTGGAADPTITGWTDCGAGKVKGTSGTFALRAYYKIMGAVPDTSVTITGSGTSGDAVGGIAFAFTGINSTTPMDATAVGVGATATSTNPDPGAITPAHNGAVILAGAVSTRDIAITVSTGFTGLTQVDPNATRSMTLAGEYQIMAANAGGGASQNIAAIGSWATGIWATITVALNAGLIKLPDATPLATASPSLGTPALTQASSAITDNFNRADGGLGSNWINVPTLTAAINIVSNQAAISGSWHFVYWNPSTNAFSNDQYSEATILSDWGLVTVRNQTGATSGGYFATLQGNTIYLYRYDGGSFALITSAGSPAPGPSTVVRLAIAGSTLTVSVNGTAVITTTEATYASGSPGFGGYAGSVLDNWSAGGAGAAAPAQFLTIPQVVTAGGVIDGVSDQVSYGGAMATHFAWGDGAIRFRGTLSSLAVKDYQQAMNYCLIQDGTLIASISTSSSGTMDFTTVATGLSGTHDYQLINATGTQGGGYWYGIQIGASDTIVPSGLSSKAIEVFYGDSITIGVGASNKNPPDNNPPFANTLQTDMWPLVNHYGRFAMRVAASGTGIVAGGFWGQTNTAAVGTGSPVRVWVRFGTNDISNVTPLGTDYTSPNTTFIGGYCAMLTSLRAAIGPTVPIICEGIFDRYDGSLVPSYNAAIQTAVSSYISNSGDAHISYLSTSGWINPGGADTYDGLHPNQSGYAKIYTNELTVGDIGAVSGPVNLTAVPLACGAAGLGTPALTLVQHVLAASPLATGAASLGVPDFAQLGPPTAFFIAWDSVNIGASITLSNNDLTATYVGGGNSHVRGTVSSSSGKKYCEHHVIAVGASLSFGLLNDSETFSNWLGASANSTAMGSSGYVYTYGNAVAVYAPFTTGDTVCLAVDLDARLAWWRTNGGYWNNDASANPATGTGGLTWVPAGANYPGSELGVSASLTSNFGVSAFSYSVPAGYTGWTRPPPPTDALPAAVALATSAPSLGTPVLAAGGVSVAATSLATAAPGLGVPAFGQKHALLGVALATASPGLDTPAATRRVALPPAMMLATSAPSLGAPAVALRVFDLAASPLTVSPALEAVPAFYSFVIGLPLATVSPGLAAPAFGQKHNLTATPLATAPPALNAPPVIVGGVFSGVPLSTAAPVLGVPTIGQKHNFAGTALATAAPGLTAPAVVLARDLIATPLATVVLALTTPTLGQQHALAATALASAGPGLTAPAVVLARDLIATPLAAGALGLATPAFGQKHALAGVALTTTAPGLASSAIALARDLIATPLATTAPAFAVPAMAQTHALAGLTLGTSAPGLGLPSVGNIYVFTALSFATASPQFGTPNLSAVVYPLAALGLTTVSPALGAPALTQIPVFAAPALAVAPAVLGAPALGQVHAFAPVPLITASLALPTPVFVQVHAFTGALVTGSPSLATPALKQIHVLTGVVLATAAPTLDAPGVAIAPVNLTAASLATTSPALGTPVLGRVYALADAAALATVSPGLSTPAFRQTHAFAGIALATAKPALDAPNVITGRVLSADPLATASPGLSVPVLGQRYPLLTAALATAAPGLATPTLHQGHAFAAVPLATAPPVFGGASLSPIAIFQAKSLTTGSPSFDLPIMRQFTRLTGRPIMVSSPGLLAPAIRQLHLLSAADFAAAGGQAFSLPTLHIRQYTNILFLRGYMPTAAEFSGRIDTARNILDERHEHPPQAARIYSG